MTGADLVEFLREQFSGPAAEQLGRAAGFTASTAARATQAALPLVLSGVVNRARTEAGAADLLTRSRGLERLTDAGGQLNLTPLGDSAEVARLEGQGRGLLGSLFPNVDEVTGRLGSAVGGSGASAGRLLALLSPLVLALVAGRVRSGGLTPGGLSSLIGGAGPLLPALLPAGLAALTPLLAPPVTVETVAVAAPPPRLIETPPPPAAPVTTTTVTTTRRGGFPWWLIPLLLLLGLGGCWVLQSRPAVAPTAAEGTAPVTTGLVITEPEAGAEVPATGFSLRGTGPAGETFQLFRGDTEVGTINVGEDGTWNVDVVGEATEVGEQTYSVRTPGGTEVATLLVTAVALAEDLTATTGDDTGEAGGPDESAAEFTITQPADGAEVLASGFNLSGIGPAGETFQLFRGDAGAGTINVSQDGTWNVDVVGEATDLGEQTYTVRTPGGTEVAALPVTAVAVAESGTVTPGQPRVTVSEPAGGTEVPAAGFDIAGTGRAGETLELIENDAAGPEDGSVGTFTVGEDGTWTVDVPGPTPGDKVYVIRTPAGDELATLPLTVVSARTPDDCTGDLTLSLDDGERVTAPFRFGGLGTAETYTVTVRRGERVVGTRRVALTPDCTWSYLSRPGGREGVESRVTYEVRPSAADPASAPLTQVNLTVVGSGVNFNRAGEYVGPTGN